MYAKFFFTSLKLALTHRFDAVHAFRALPEGLVAWLVARLTFRHVTIYAHGEELTTWGNGGKYKAMRFALRHADTVIANSDFTRDTLINIGVNEERIVRINPGVDLTRFRPGLPCDDLKIRVGLEPGQQLILSVGRLSRRKGFDMVVKSLPVLARQGLDLHYALIGIGEDRDYLTNLAEELGVADKVHLLGHVSPDDLPRWYCACDVFLMPNREINGDNEGFGMVFIEAAACGKPVIGGVDGGTGSAIVDGVTGLRVNGSNANELESALKCLLADNLSAKKIGESALIRAIDEFSWAQVARKTKHIQENR